MQKQPKLITSPMIIQFFHPGEEYDVKNGKAGQPVQVPWVTKRKNCRCCGHYRRLVSHKGDFITDTGKKKTDQLVFWTEWEACTTAIKMWPTNTDPRFARSIHAVKTPLQGFRKGGINTDPCVFGSTFKYCFCQQARRTLRNLAPGSLILFGSRLKSQFFLDTVFVVDGSIPYVTGSIGCPASSNEYRELTLYRLGSGEQRTLYRGKTLSAMDSTTMYSFVPARLFEAGNLRCSKRFYLDINAANQFFPIGAQRKLREDIGRFFWKIPASPKTILDVWKEIVRQVYAARFVPGVHFDWP